ncbi:hypothetical protein TAGGR_1342 [Thermodesulfovibrio aggregans]|uniref:Uncharacterized protein n=1 Tax=Thermodesulfovibrio aggregans TaxID=86166 RepID=A0A0U9HMR5_9BACT|nr:hypothetical protein [Thermodesulfovibrio aggregans]GAQ94164.1 hypothetical protein TAGGR_1342 [Thermodesulfovibrio aggregans]
MKAQIEIEFKDLPVEKIQRAIMEMIQTFKTLDMIDDARFQIFTPNGTVTEKCIVQENKVVA